MTVTLPPRIQTKKPRRDNRIRSRPHLNWVASHRCCVPNCQARDIIPHHVRLGTDGAAGIKPGDDWAISLCNDHHTLGKDAVHRLGEIMFEERFNISIFDLAQEFWRKSPYRARIEAKLRRAG